MKKSKINGKDLLLLFLYSPGVKDYKNERIQGLTRLQKMMFLFEKEVKNDFYRNEQPVLPLFSAYHYGPYSSELNENLEFFITIKFIIAEDTDIPVPNSDCYMLMNGEYEYGVNLDKEIKYEKEYSLTELGISYVEQELISHLTMPQMQLLKNFKNQINNTDLKSLLYYVYNKYPEMASKSLIRDKYLI